MVVMDEFQNCWEELEPATVTSSIIKDISQGQYLDVICSNFVKDLLGTTPEGSSIRKVWTESLEKYAAANKDKETELNIISAGVASLLLFIQANWTGPQFDISKVHEIIFNHLKFSEYLNQDIIQDLVLDGESLIEVIEYPELLLLTSVLLSFSYKEFSDSYLGKLWYFRYLYIHQNVLEESSPEIFEKVNSVMDELINLTTNFNNQQLTQLHLEFSRVHIYYDYVNKSKAAIDNAMKYSGLQTSFTGALGKRTRFQENNVSQLTLKVSLDSSEVLSNGSTDSESEVCPINLNLNDEVRLNKVSFANNSDGKFPELTGLQQAAVLALFHQNQKSEAKDTLADEELQAILTCILDKPKLWCIQFSALYLRSKMEIFNKRTVERAMLQIQGLIDSFKETEPPSNIRFKYFFISYLPPRWIVDSMFANVLMSLGSVKSALEIYLRLHQWDEVIYCYNVLGLRHKAAEIIRKEMAKKETPKLWCLLGDATDDPSCYEKAWTISGNRSARAQRDWALYLYHRKKYEECIEHFQESLKLNSLQGDVWFRLAYAALHEEKWEVSAEAYRRYCVLDTESFEAWNNLARCYCELKQIPRARRALQEALKIDYNNWRVWDNYMIVSSDLKEYEEVIRSYQQILNLKEKHIDIPVLKALTEGLKKLINSGEKEIDKLRSSALTLFGRLTAQVMNNSELWFLYSEIVKTDSLQDLTKKHQLLLKAYSSAANKQSWEKDTESCNKIIQILCQLLDVSVNLEQRSDQVSAKMAVVGTIAKLEKEYPDGGLCKLLKEKLNSLIQILDK